MTAFELVFFLREAMKRMSEVGIRIDDWKYTDMFKEYNELVNRGEKKEYIKTLLASNYNVSESTVNRVITRFCNKL